MGKHTLIGKTQITIINRATGEVRELTTDELDLDHTKDAAPQGAHRHVDTISWPTEDIA